MSAPKTDIEIARAATPRPIQEIAAALGIPDEAVYRYGPTKAKLAAGFVAEARSRPRGKLLLVTAISPTPAGEGKTTTTVGLGDALHHLGHKAAICLREPSLGPCFGVKGGAAGGGYAQVIPMDEINLHFTGDFHAITSANNLLATMLDNHIYWGNELDIDPRRVSWKRCIDLNDRALRHVVAGLDAAVREDGFNITVASEIMAIFCLATSIDDLKQRLSKIIVGETRGRKPITAADLEAVGAMTALLKDALQPNLVQSLEGTPAFVHGGPFANIAHGCNSVLATTTALGLADYVVTEAGFGADLGAEKFLDIKCRYAELDPAAVVIVATVRALKMHGGVAKNALGAENPDAVKAGAANLRRHLQNLAKFGMPAVVALNHFTADTEAEVAAVREICAELEVPMHVCRHWADGGKGAADLAREVVRIAESGSAKYRRIYADDLPLEEKIRTITREIYGAGEVTFEPAAAKRLAEWQAAGYGALPVCMAKTQYSFSTDPTLLGAPSGHTVHVREVRLAAGAGFVVALCGEIMTMPGLPRRPSAVNVDVDAAGEIIGLS